MPKREPEITALEAVYAALKPLEPEVRRKVLASVYSLLEVPSQEPSQQHPPGKDGSLPKPPTDGGRAESSRPVGLTELVREKSPGTNAQRIVLFAYYREKHEGISRFSSDDLKEYFGKAREHPPQNYSRDFREAVKRGWIHEDDSDSYITSKGIEAVEAGFTGERRYRGRPTRTSSRRQTRRRIGKRAKETKRQRSR